MLFGQRGVFKPLDGSQDADKWGVLALRLSGVIKVGILKLDTANLMMIAKAKYLLFELYSTWGNREMKKKNEFINVLSMQLIKRPLEVPLRQFKWKSS